MEIAGIERSLRRCAGRRDPRVAADRDQSLDTYVGHHAGERILAGRSGAATPK